MNIVLLGTSTDDKRFLILSIARIMSCDKKTIIFTKNPYNYDEEPEEAYDYCGIEIRHFDTVNALENCLCEECNNLIDLEEYIPISVSYRIVAVCETYRRMVENCVKLVGAYSWVNPTLEIYVVYLNVMEYCKADKKYLDLFWERSVPSFTKLKEAYSVYFEEGNRVALLESQFSDTLSIKKLTDSMKKSLSEIIEDLLSIDSKQMKKIIRMAERMK